MPTKVPRSKAGKQRAVAKDMRRWKKGTLHSGGKHGPVVESQAQAIAIALSKAGVKPKK